MTSLERFKGIDLYVLCTCMISNCVFIGRNLFSSKSTKYTTVGKSLLRLGIIAWDVYPTYVEINNNMSYKSQMWSNN
jgi:hypothetical protein